MADKEIRIRNVKAEILLIKAFTICRKKGRSAILDRISEEHFGSKVGKLVWKRAQILHTNNNLPYRGGWQVLVNDPVLHNKQPVQDILEQFNDAEVSGKSKFVLELTKTLEFFRQKRDAYNSIESAYTKLSEAEDQNEVSDALIPIISAARTVTDVRAKDAFFRLDTLNLLETLRIAKAKRGSGNLARTLWHQFDAVNSGFSFGSLVTIAATTGGGKSAVAFLNMMINFALQGLKVAGASLEMSKELIAERQAAYVSGIPMHKIRSGTWSSEEEKHINKSSQLLLELIAKRGGSFWVLKQLKKDSSINEMLTLLYEKGPNVILIDYINLLKLPRGQDKWEALGEVAREAKVFADAHDCLVILLAQLNEEERVKYSRAVEEHSDNVIVWSYPPQNRPGFIHVKQIKARNQILYNFYLVEDFANMRIYDLLEPTGLALMLSRSSGMAYKQKTNEYFGIRRLIEIQDTLDLDSIGVPKHKFIDDINWGDFVDRSVPPPNVPDISAVMGMVREMLYFIASYEPMVAKVLLDNIKESEILKPYEEFIEDLDLPYSAKILLGLVEEKESSNGDKKRRLLAKIEQDLLTATQDLYLEGDKVVKEDRKSDRLTSRKKVYEDTHEQIHAGKDPEKPLRKRRRRKEVVDPGISNSKWMQLNNSYSKRQKMRADSIPQQTGIDGASPLDSMNALPKEEIVTLAKASKSRKAASDFKKHWIKLGKDSPSSPDTIKEHMLLDGGPDEPFFLLGFKEAYIDKLEKNIELVGFHILKKADKIESQIDMLLASYFSSNEGKKVWGKGMQNEVRVNNLVASLVSKVIEKNLDLHSSIEADKKKLPSIENIFSELNVNRNGKSFLTKVCNKAKNERHPLLPFVDVSIADTEKISANRNGYIQKLRSNNGFLGNLTPLLDTEEILDSPYIILFSKPQYIGAITPSNFRKYNTPEFYIATIKTGVFSKILKESHKEKEKLIRSLSWALVNPDYRDNMPLLESIRQGLLSFITKIDKSNQIASFYMENSS